MGKFLEVGTRTIIESRFLFSSTTEKLIYVHRDLPGQDIGAEEVL